MKVELQEPYRSIRDLTIVPNEISDFCILVGKNGAGKSHFLEAIDKEKIKVDNIEKIKIRYINYYAVSTSYDYPMLTEGVQKAWDTFVNFRQHKSSATLTDLDAYINQIEKYQGDLIYNAIHGCIDSTKDEVSQIQTIDFNTFKVHAAYHEPVGLSDILYSLNGILRRKWSDHILRHFKEEDLPPLPLWEEINTQLKALDIPHTIKYPDFSAEDLLKKGINNISYEIKLSTPEGEEIDITDLSDGEKTLFLLALMGIISHKLPDFPELLLLDEPDIHLHPAMIDKFIDIINKVFIDNGCKVIITTHSPVIVSKVDGKSIYQIEKIKSKHRISKIDQKDAVFILSDGVMNLDTVLDLVLKDAFDRDITIISEGDNIHHIENAIQILDPELFEKIAFPFYHYPILKNSTADTNLIYLYKIFSQLRVKNKILFVFDWDVEERYINGKKIPEILKKEHVKESNVDSFIFTENKKKGFLERGIENLYNKYDMDGCNPKKGKALLKWIKTNLNEPEAFKNFQPLVDEIKNLIKK